MRRLTFVGFLKQYLAHLTGSPTQSLTKLVKLALGPAPRAKEPLFLYTVATNQLGRLSALTADTAFGEEFDALIEAYPQPTQLLEALRNGTAKLPPRYLKVYDSYLALTAQTDTNRHATALLAQKINALMASKHLSKYHIYTALHLNPGNVNSFLCHSDPTKVSRQTATRILDFVQAA
jgi:hypothetical protein